MEPHGPAPGLFGAMSNVISLDAGAPRSAEAALAAAKAVIKLYRSQNLDAQEALERIIAALDAPIAGQEIPVYPPAQGDGS
jgi:hypothetical protein